MRSKLLLILVVVAVVVAGLWLANNKNDSGSLKNTVGDTIDNAADNVPKATNNVSVVNMAFSPANIVVRKGTTVHWLNEDAVQHTITENDDKDGPSSPLLDKGQSYDFTFKETGVYHYNCSIHTEMTGTVTVTE
jgi:plastocyanin